MLREPDLTRDPSEPHAAVHVPFQSASSFAEREGIKRRQPIARLHCRAFQFPVRLFRHLLGFNGDSADYRLKLLL